ncbi:MAG: CRTAC1 family protein [Planctomycetes bacterium]|nr:CRTAC1 family protein [Planctomycetota bacterium]
MIVAPSAQEVPPAQAAPADWFVDVSAPWGVDFRHRNGGGGEKHFPEIMSGGVAVLDYDGDGARDLFFAQGAPFPGCPTEGVDFRDRLLRRAGGRFVDVTDAAGCSTPRYTLSALAPDWDGDGDPDLVLCEFGGVSLLRNDGGRFVDATGASGLAESGWPQCAAAADFDQDGDLDLYVGHYVVYDPQAALWCGEREKGPDYRSYCHPDEYPPEADRLWENVGGGRFVDATARAGMAGALGKCLGLLPFDAEGDGDVDLYVANDSTPNFLWRNDGALRFTEVGLDAGCAVSGRGLAQASMGVDGADIDLDGDIDVVCTNLALEPNALYRNDGDGFFSERGLESGLGEPSLIWVGFGARFLDVDRDGLEELFVVNGHVVDTIERTHGGQSFAQPSHLYLNRGRGRFRLAGPEAGAWLQERRVARALASLDLEDDGDLDLVVVENHGRASLLRNDAPTRGGWIGFELVGADANRAAIGARVTLTAGGVRQLREVRGTCSYDSFVDLRALFGLGAASTVDAVEVRWPRGGLTRIEAPEAGRYHVVVEPAEGERSRR